MKKYFLLFASLVSVSTVHAETLQVDQNRSRVHVDAKATGHAFSGTLKKFQASGTGNGGTLDPQSFSMTWNFADLKTGDAKRDKEMLHWLGGGNPSGSFQFTKAWKQGNSNQAMGTLTIHGVSKTISFPYTISRDGEWVTVDGTAHMDYTNFKLPVIRAMALMTVDPKLAIRFHIVGKVK